ncbi:hypothetical protein LINPERPRIM_LOCUS37596, partial [Linum perenne]
KSISLSHYQPPSHITPLPPKQLITSGHPTTHSIISIPTPHKPTQSESFSNPTSHITTHHKTFNASHGTNSLRVNG